MIESAEEFIRLVDSHDRLERFRASRDEAPVAVWLDVIDRFPRYKADVAFNKPVPMEVLDILAGDPDERVRDAVADRGKLDAPIRYRLASDPSGSIRGSIAGHQNTEEPELLDRFSRDPDCLVRQYATEKRAWLTERKAR